MPLREALWPVEVSTIFAPFTGMSKIIPFLELLIYFIKWFFLQFKDPWRECAGQPGAARSHGIPKLLSVPWWQPNRNKQWWHDLVSTFKQQKSLGRFVIMSLQPLYIFLVRFGTSKRDNNAQRIQATLAMSCPSLFRQICALLFRAHVTLRQRYKP